MVTPATAPVPSPGEDALLIEGDALPAPLVVVAEPLPTVGRLVLGGSGTAPP